MIKVKKEELKAFLETRKEHIERPIYAGIGEIISGVSLIFTLFASDYDSDLLVPPEYLDVLTLLLGAVLIGMGIYSLVTGFRLRQTVQNLYASICELDVKRLHVVNIVLVSLPDSGKYLLVRNEAWKCAIFPSYNSISAPYNKDMEMERIRNSFFRDTGVKVQNVTYLNAMEKHIKLCAGTDLPFRYEFHFYRVDPASDMEGLKTHNGKQYVWKSLDSMRKDKNIMEKNEDVVNHVAEIEGIPYN